MRSPQLPINRTGLCPRATRMPDLVAESRSGSEFPYLDSGFDSSFLRMRRSSIKLSAVIVHNTDANMIITLVSIGVGSSPADHCIRDMRHGARVNPPHWGVRCRHSHGR